MEKTLPDEYVEALEQIELKNLIFSEISSKFLVKNYQPGEINININNQCEHVREGTSNNYSALDKYDIEGNVQEKLIFQIHFELLVSFTCKAPIEDKFIKEFDDDTLHVITHPYLRSTVQELTGKMGLPPLVLPLWRRRTAIEKHETSEQEKQG